MYIITQAMVMGLKTPRHRMHDDKTELSHLLNLSLVANLSFITNQAQKEYMGIFPRPHNNHAQ